MTEVTKRDKSGEKIKLLRANQEDKQQLIGNSFHFEGLTLSLAKGPKCDSRQQLRTVSYKMRKMKKKK